MKIHIVLHIVLLLILVTMFMVNFYKIDDIQFTFIFILLLVLLYTYHNGKVSSDFTENFVAMKINENPNLKKIDYDLFENKLFNLPNKVSQRIVPRLQYIEEAYKPDKEKRNEKHTIDENEYISKKDAYVCDIAEDGSATINKDKMKLLREEYRVIDQVLFALKAMNQPAWDKLVDFDPERDGKDTTTAK